MNEWSNRSGKMKQEERRWNLRGKVTCKKWAKEEEKAKETERSGRK